MRNLRYSSWSEPVMLCVCVGTVQYSINDMAEEVKMKPCISGCRAKLNFINKIWKVAAEYADCSISR